MTCPFLRALDLLGHGARPANGRPVTLGSMAHDVVEQLGGQRVDLLVGHSMGALVALTLAQEHPELLAGLVLEDPPALEPGLDGNDVAVNIEREIGRADEQPAQMETELLIRNPLWARADASNAVANLRSLDVEAVTRWLRTERWDLAGLVCACPVPLHLLVAAGEKSATTEPSRTDVLWFLGPERVSEVESSHSVHRDRPGIWLATVLRQLSR